MKNIVRENKINEIRSMGGTLYFIESMFGSWLTSLVNWDMTFNPDKAKAFLTKEEAEEALQALNVLYGARFYSYSVTEHIYQVKFGLTNLHIVKPEPKIFGESTEKSISKFDTLHSIVDQLEYCGYESEAGVLKKNTAFIALKRMAEKEKMKKDAEAWKEYM